jgi:hypothetical protein
VRALGCVTGEIREVAPHRRELPCKTFLSFHALETGEQSVHQPGDYVRTQRETRGEISGVLTLDPRALEKWRVCQNIRRGAELFEQLLGRVQVAFPRA